jgi:hypothetical protein
MRKNAYHCSGCESILDCPIAFGPQSENCDLYVRSSFHDCHKCLNFGKACRNSGLIRCDFRPRVPEVAAAHVMNRGRHK